ncbi:MAG: hypothetical protein ACLQDY_16550 [Streptosporangiaceae bacterium]
MAAIFVIAAAVVFVAGGIAGVIILVSVASIREDRRPRLNREAPDRITAAGRYVTRLDVRRPTDTTRRGRREDSYLEVTGRSERGDPWA